MSSDRHPKQVIVVRKDLNMRKGKIAAQCAHASLGAILDQMTDHTQLLDYAEKVLSMKIGSALEQWVHGIFTKICVYVNSEEELLSIHRTAVQQGMICKLITDVGKTEFQGVPTHTVVAIGPEWNDRVDEITGKLPLL